MSQGSFNFDPSQYPGFDFSSLGADAAGFQNAPYTGGQQPPQPGQQPALGPNQMGPPAPGQQQVPMPAGTTYPPGQMQGPMMGQQPGSYNVNPANFLGGDQGSVAGFDASGQSNLDGAAGQAGQLPGQFSPDQSGGGPGSYQPPGYPPMPQYGGGGGNGPMAQAAGQNIAPGFFAANAAGQAQNAANQAEQDNRVRLSQVMGMYDTDINQQTPGAYAQMLGLAGQNQAYNQMRNQQQENQAVGGTTQRMMAMGLGNSTVMPSVTQAARQPYLANEANISSNAAQQKLGVLGQQQNQLEGERSSQRGALYGVSNPYPSGGGGRSYGGYNPSYL